MGQEFRSMAYSDDGAILALGAANGEVVIFAGGNVGNLPIFSGTVWDIDFSPDGRLVAFAGPPNLVLLWSLENGLPVNLLDDHRSVVRVVAFSPDGRLVATGSEDSTVQVWAVGE
jgi:WD40 repeat protein